VQMVSDRRQFVNPSLLGFVDGRKAVQSIGRYQTFDSKKAFKRSGGSPTLNIKNSGGR
jgi:hypothetical protein